MKVEVFTFCWNEMAALPFAVDYWRRYASHVTVFDNGSTDGSIEFMKNNSDLISIEKFETGGQINDQILLNYKNDSWGQARGRADFVVVCDMDEMLIPVHGELERMKREGCTICEPRWFQMMSEEIPQHEDGKLLHEIRPWAFQEPGKSILFDPNKITRINYAPGAHTCRPEGLVKWFDGGIYCLHTNHNFSYRSKIERYRQMYARMSNLNKQKGWGIHYGFSEDKIREWWTQVWASTVDFDEIIRQHG